ncbi:MAG: GNAT family N-acetyltransferase [Myxococcales bacterium]|nr:GNAT family N-acetyltransferase [Myxococcales bacterium]
MELRLLTSIAEVEPDAWDALVGPDDPFSAHAYLRALEDSGTACPSTGWHPCHVTLWEDGRLVGAVAAYLKDHGRAEFVFDDHWAMTAWRLGVPYYPKLVAMTPVTPATGDRLLIRADCEPRLVTARLVDGLLEAARHRGASSVHLLYLRPEQHALLAADGRLVQSVSVQLHWRNEGYASFAGYLERLRAPLRKQIRRERAALAASGLRIELVPHERFDATLTASLARFYRANCLRHGFVGYLTDEFFAALVGPAGCHALAVVAHRDGIAVAGALAFEKGGRLYGRWWGTLVEQPFLHFELCYYRLIERAIERGLHHFEAGPGGAHKLRRGLQPVTVPAMHWFADPALARAVRRSLPHERRWFESHARDLEAHGPFRRG